MPNCAASRRWKFSAAEPFPPAAIRCCCAPPSSPMSGLCVTMRSRSGPTRSSRRCRRWAGRSGHKAVVSGQGSGGIRVRARVSAATRLSTNTAAEAARFHTNPNQECRPVLYYLVPPTLTRYCTHRSCEYHQEGPLLGTRYSDPSSTTSQPPGTRYTTLATNDLVSTANWGILPATQVPKNNLSRMSFTHVCKGVVCRGSYRRI